MESSDACSKPLSGRLQRKALLKSSERIAPIRRVREATPWSGTRASEAKDWKVLMPSLGGAAPTEEASALTFRSVQTSLKMMNQTTSVKIPEPSTDERQLWNIIFASAGNRILLVAHNLKLFPVLAAKPCTLIDVCNAIAIEQRPAEVILTVLTSIGLLQLENGFYSLTSVAQDYLLESSPTYFGGFLEMLFANDKLFSVESLKKAVLTNSPQVYDNGQLFESHEEQAEKARAFTYAMHGHSMGPALALPKLIDLSEHRLLLDIGGGSGAHAIGAALEWSNLKAVVLDLPPVCEVAHELITRYDLQSRLQTEVIDLWSDPFPIADLHFYSDIYHDWSPEKCRFLTQKSFESLESGGRIILHEMLYDDQKTGPYPTAAYNMAMLLWTEGQQFSGHELSVMLTEVGFTNVEVTPSRGYWSLITGRKP